MIPYPYKFVDFGGTDLSEISGLVVEGIYQRIIDALNRCGEVVLYNWYFASIPIAPSYCRIEVRSGYIIVNEVVEIRDDDTVWVESLMPQPPAIEPVSVESNGSYYVPEGVDGFNPVIVAVPPPVIQRLDAESNGTYYTLKGVDGFNPVNVAVPSPVLQSLEVESNGIYLPSQYNADGFSSVEVDVSGAGSNLIFHLGRLEINTGAITPSNEYCYSDLIPIADPADTWFMDLARQDLNSYYIGLIFYAEDGVTHVSFIRQYMQYRVYAASIPATAKFFRIANKVANMSFAHLIAINGNIAFINSNATLLVNKEE